MYCAYRFSIFFYSSGTCSNPPRSRRTEASGHKARGDGDQALLTGQHPPDSGGGQHYRRVPPPRHGGQKEEVGGRQSGEGAGLRAEVLQSPGADEELSE